MIIYYAGWLFLVVISLIVSVAAFMWGLRTGQFSDQERARFLPLGKDLLSEPVPAVSRMKQKFHAVSICVITATALAAFAAALTIGLYHR